VASLGERDDKINPAYGFRSRTWNFSDLRDAGFIRQPCRLKSGLLNSESY